MQEENATLTFVRKKNAIVYSGVVAGLLEKLLLIQQNTGLHEHGWYFVVLSNFFKAFALLNIPKGKFGVFFLLIKFNFKLFYDSVNYKKS